MGADGEDIEEGRRSAASATAADASTSLSNGHSETTPLLQDQPKNAASTGQQEQNQTEGQTQGADGNEVGVKAFVPDWVRGQIREPKIQRRVG